MRKYIAFVGVLFCKNHFNNIVFYNFEKSKESEVFVQCMRYHIEIENLPIIIMWHNS